MNWRARPFLIPSSSSQRPPLRPPQLNWGVGCNCSFRHGAMPSRHNRQRLTSIPAQPLQEPKPRFGVAVNLAWGVRWGLAYATAFSAFVLLMGLLRRSFEYPE